MFGLSRPEKKILIPVLSILLGLCTLAYFAHQYSNRLIAASEAIEQGEGIKNHIKEVFAHSLDLETGVLNFILTGDEHLIEAANRNITDIIVHLHQLSSAQGITPGQKIQIDQLRALVDDKSATTMHTIEVRRLKGMIEAIALIKEGKEKGLMDQIRSLVANMVGEADAKLNLLKEEQHRAIHHFALTFYFLLLKIAITVSTVLTLLVLYFKRRNKSEKLLKESKALFHNVLDHTSSSISIKDLSGRFILINQAYEKAFSIREEDIKGKTVYDLFDKDIAESIRNADMDVIRNQQQMNFEEVAPTKGQLRHFTSLKFPLFDAHHIPFAICSISTDETEKILIEKQHHEQMSHVLDLFNNAPCGYLASNEEGIIIEINDTMLKWLGYTRNEIIGIMPSRNLISKESQHIFAHYFPRIKTGEIKSVFDLEIIYQRKDGSKITVVANTMGQYDEEGNFMHTRTSIFDISYRKRVEELVTHN